MTDSEREYMERYIYEAVRKVPKRQRKEMEMELRELIEDMSETMPMKEVLLKMGSPKDFAKQYREDSGYIIGPEYYDDYLWVMKVVLICVESSVLLSGIIGILLHEGAYVELFGKLTGNLILAGFAVVGAVTLIFAVLQRRKIRVEINEKKKWSPEKLSPIPVKKARISRGDSIVGIVFLVLFSALLAFAPQLFSAYSVKGEELQYVSIFNLEKWELILPVFLLSLFISLTDEVIRLVVGRYCQIVMISNLIANTLQILFAVILLKVLPFWNPEFPEKVKTMYQLTAEDSGFQFLLKWNLEFLSNLFLVLICIAALGEIAVTVYKTLRYGESSWQ